MGVRVQGPGSRMGVGRDTQGSCRSLTLQAPETAPSGIPVQNSTVVFPLTGLETLSMSEF